MDSRSSILLCFLIFWIKPTNIIAQDMSYWSNQYEKTFKDIYSNVEQQGKNYNSLTEKYAILNQKKELDTIISSLGRVPEDKAEVVFKLCSYMLRIPRKKVSEHILFVENSSSILLPYFKQWLTAYSHNHLDKNRINNTPPNIRFTLLRMFSLYIHFSKELILNSVEDYIKSFPERTFYLLSLYPYHPKSEYLIDYTIENNISPFYSELKEKQNQQEPFVANSNSKLLVALLQMRNSKYSDRILPFFDLYLNDLLNLDNIIHRSKHIKSYIRFLIKERMRQSQQRYLYKKTYTYDVLNDKLTYYIDQYIITPINIRLDAPFDERFKPIWGFNSIELYYVIVYGDEVLFTSTFNGLYKVFMRKMDPKNGYYFLEKMYFDKFRKWIKIVSSFGKFSRNHNANFLTTMSVSQSKMLLNKFTKDIFYDTKERLENAMDVANTFVVLENNDDRKSILGQVSLQKEITEMNKDRAANIYYATLEVLLNNAGKPFSDSLKNKYNIQEISNISFETISNYSYRINERVFFYNDFDGANAYYHFQLHLKRRGWRRIRSTGQWVEFKKNIGIWSIHIFLTTPDLNKSEDDFSNMNALENYFSKRNLKTHIIAHRGHSYHFGQTRKYITHHSKLVFLGSCGSNTNISNVLNLSNSAHIIATRQIAKTEINTHFLILINEELLKYKFLVWDNIWAKGKKIFENTISKNNFDDYIPPNKNLGALFFKLYYHQLDDVLLKKY